ncbi:MAG: 30S ribosomal protein S5 [Candidatus Altiarchaeota archaeon]
MEDKANIEEIGDETIIEKRIDLDSWVPKTKLGVLVKSGEIKTIHEVLLRPEPIKEVEIVDKLLPDLKEEILSVSRVQRVTDSGRRTKFRIVVVVGNENGYVGVGSAKGKEAGPTIRKAIDNAKKNIKEVKRGCGSWECSCKLPHTVPFRVVGDAGSVRVILMPAPRGTGLVAGAIARKVLNLAGIKDVYSYTQGFTRSNINFAKATVNALENTNKIKLTGEEIEKLKIFSGAVAKT